MYPVVMPTQRWPGGLAGNPVFLLKQRWSQVEAVGGPHQLQGRLGPEIEPGAGSPGERQGRAWCWCGSEVAPGSGLQLWGKVGLSLSPVPVGSGTWAHIRWAVSH